MKKINFDKILLYTIAIVALSLSIVTLKNEFGKSKVVYVDIGKLLEGYKFKKDLEDEGTKNLYKIKNAVDSLKMVQKLKNDPLVDSQIVYAEKAFDQYYAYSNQEMTKKIWERLNPLLEEFGKQNNYSLIIGANGAGNVLYGEKRNDVTELAINFMNKKYEKGN